MSTVHEFSDGEPIELRRTGASHLNVMARAQKVLANPKRYDPILRNCEHTANEVIHGRPRSPLLVIVGTIAALAFLWFIFRRSS